MIFRKTASDRARAPLRKAERDGAMPRRPRLLASWQCDASGRLSCHWIEASDPSGEPGA